MYATESQYCPLVCKNAMEMVMAAVVGGVVSLRTSISN
jgi:hypothetical protein